MGLNTPEEKSFDANGNGATAYLLSRCDSNDPNAGAGAVPDSEGSWTDGSLANFMPPSITCKCEA